MQKNNKITYVQFLYWLRGVEEMQEEGWAPNTSQWKKIREKIESIDDTQQTTYAVNRTMVEETPGAVIMPSSSLNRPPSPPRSDAPLASGAQTTPVKTPNIDTSSGKYDSSFT